MEIFDTLLFPPGAWKKEDYGNYYAAGVSGLNFHENYYTVYFRPGKHPGDSAVVTAIEPAIPEMILINNVRTGTPRSGDNVIIYGEPNRNKRILTGTIPAGKSSFAVKGSMPNPALACATLFRQFLATSGIIFISSANPYITPSTHQTLAIHYSPSLPELVKITNTRSNNLFAESMLKTIAVKNNSAGTTENGIKILKQHITRSTNEPFSIIDGSGLSDSNRISPKAIVDFLLSMQKKESFPAFYSSLAISCRSGTLKDFGCGTVLENNLHAKTGSKKKVRCYAGYLPGKNNDLIAFCLMVNDYTCSHAVLKHEAEKLLESLFE